jgi:putative ABC transport system permease protein
MHDFFFRNLLRLLPAEFRGDYGREMETAFRDERREAAHPGALLGLWLSAIADVLKTAPSEHWDIFKRDARFAWRTAIARPAHTLTAVFTLALGLGASVVMFAVVDAVMLSPLPYGEPDELVMVQETSKGGEGSNMGYLTFTDLRSRARSFETLAAMSQSFPILSGDNRDAERSSAMRVSSSYFDMIGVKPALGRAFTEAEDQPGAARRVAILTDGLWRRRFDADPAILGRPVMLSGAPFVVVGVMPKGFEDLVGERMYTGAEMWVPLGYDPAASFACRTCRHLRVIGRLAPGVTDATAQGEADALLAGLSKEHPTEYHEPGSRIIPLTEVFLGPVRTTLSVLSIGVFALLLVACGTVANLLLLRANERAKEIAIRSALGVSPGRLARQLITESLLLAIAGGIAGLVPALAAVRLLAIAGPDQLPRLHQIALDERSFVMAFALILLSGILFGLAPMRQIVRRDLARDIHGGSRNTSGSWRLRSTLVAGNVAMAAVLLVGSGLLVKSLLGLLAVNPGFDTRGVLTLQVSLAGPEFQVDDNAQAIAATVGFYDRALARVRALPGVTGAGGVTTLPLGGNNDGYGLHIVSRPVENPEAAPHADRFVVTPDYFTTLSIPLVRGRLLSEVDAQSAPLTAVINERLARELFPNEDPLGQSLRLGPIDAEARTIVGVVRDVSHGSLDRRPAYQVYVPQAQWAWAERALTLVVRSSGDPSALARPVRDALREIDPRQPLTAIVPYEEIVSASMGARRLAAWLLSGFALSAFTLAVVGLYGAVSVLVGQKQREIGVRLVLGASTSEIRGMILARGMQPVIAGLVLGMAAATLSVFALDSLLYGVRPLDPASFGAAFVALSAAALGACAIPAWRASSTDPVTTLRAE